MIEQFIHTLALSLEKFGSGAYLLVSLVVLLETVVVIGQFIPGSLLLLMVGFLCYMRVFDFTGMLISVSVSHLAGEYINYALGKYRGRALFREGNRFFKPSLLALAESRFHQGGARLLITGQFLGFLRPFICLTAGITGFSLVRFTVAMIIGSLLWSLVPLTFGFFFGASWQKAAMYLRDFSLVVLIAIPFAFLSGWFIQQLLALSGSLVRFLEYLNRRIRQSQWYGRMAARHPHTFDFMERRISLSRPWGLGASVGFASAAACLVLFILIWLDIYYEGRLYRADLALVHLLAQLRTAGATGFFTTVSQLGNATAVTVTVVLASAACLYARQYKSLFVIIGSVVVCSLAAQGLEYVFQRHRPDAALRAVVARGFGFPSGHATVAFALFGGLYYWLWNHPGVLKLRATLAFFLMLAAMLVGFSRLYLGVHYLSDVLGGFTLGLAGVLACGTVAANWRRLTDTPRRADVVNGTIMAIYCAVAIALAYWRPYVLTGLERSHGARELKSSVAEALAAMPTDSATLFGALYVPPNFVVTGPVDPLLERLEQTSWRAVAPADFFTRDLADPVFPAFWDHRPAAYTLELREPEGRRILRLWRTDYAIEPGGDAASAVRATPVWMGSIVEQRLVEKWGVDLYRQIPDIDRAADHLQEMLPGLTTDYIPAFRRRDLYQWSSPFFTHGHLLHIQIPPTPHSS